jgi:hypothetical protein
MQASAKPPMSRLAIKAGSSSAGQADTEAYGPSMQGWRIKFANPPHGRHAMTSSCLYVFLPYFVPLLLLALTSWLTFS